jgi:predicted GIY-YIG superfamily endonuclease
MQLYIIKSVNNFTKIGITENIEKRMKGYATHDPYFEQYKVYYFQLKKVIATSIEKEIKKKFNHYCIKTSQEWFIDNSDEIMTEVDKLVEEYKKEERKQKIKTRKKLLPDDVYEI